MKEKIRLHKGERIIKERSYDSVLPALLMFFGTLIAVLGFGVGMMIMSEIEDPSLLLIGLVGVVLIIAGRYLKSAASFQLTITNKRVIQEGPFGQFAVLPLNHISSVVGNGSALSITAAGGGRINVSIPDNVGVCNTLSDLLNQLQENVEPSVSQSSSPASPRTKAAPAASSPAQSKPTAKRAETAKKAKFVYDEGEADPFAEDAEFFDVCCPQCKENLSFVVGTKDGMCPSCGATFDLSHYAQEARIVAAGVCPDCSDTMKVDITPYLGKKFCSGCGELISDTTVVECPTCGSKHLDVITRTNAQKIIPNIEKH